MYHHAVENNKQCHKKETKPRDAGKRRVKQNSNDTFLAKSRAAALQQSKLHFEKQQNRSIIQINKEEIIKSPTFEVTTLSDSTQNSPIKVYTSNNKYDFMITSPNSPDIPTNFTSTISTPKIDKVVKKIQKFNGTPVSSTSPIENNAVPYGIIHTEQTTSNNTKTSDSATDIALTSSPKAETSKNNVRRTSLKEHKIITPTRNISQTRHPQGKVQSLI